MTFSRSIRKLEMIQFLKYRKKISTRILRKFEMNQILIEKDILQVNKKKSNNSVSLL